MGRAKLKMELIKEEKDRNTSFQKRNNSLKKQAYELATLCDIKAAVIIYGPKKATPQAHPLEPEIWPQNRDEVLELINKFKDQTPEDRKERTTLLLDVFQKSIREAQKALTRQRITNLQSKYPTWDSRFNSLKEEDLRKVVIFLENVFGNAKAKLEQMKANNTLHMMLGKKRRMDFDAENQANKYFKIDPHQALSDPMGLPIPMPLPTYQQRLPFYDNNRNQMMAEFGNEYAGGTSNSVHNAPLSMDVYDYPTMEGTLNSISYVNNMARAPPNYYGEGRQPIAQNVLEYQLMTEGSNSHQMAAASHQYYEYRKWQSR